jgi:hypothetical protein
MRSTSTAWFHHDLVDGRVIDQPSRAAGERSVGDALLNLPGRI